MRVYFQKPRFRNKRPSTNRRQRGGLSLRNAGRGTLDRGFDHLNNSIPIWIDHFFNQMIDIPVGKVQKLLNKRQKGGRSLNRRNRQKGGFFFSPVLKLLKLLV